MTKCSIFGDQPWSPFSILCHKVSCVRAVAHAISDLMLGSLFRQSSCCGHVFLAWNRTAMGLYSSQALHNNLENLLPTTISPTEILMPGCPASPPQGETIALSLICHHPFYNSPFSTVYSTSLKEPSLPHNVYYRFPPSSPWSIETGSKSLLPHCGPTLWNYPFTFFSSSPQPVCLYSIYRVRAVLTPIFWNKYKP